MNIYGHIPSPVVIDSLTFLIVILGAATVVLSCFVAMRFRQSSKELEGGGFHLSRSLMWQLTGEGVLGLGTLVFAVLAYLNRLEHVPVYAQSILRLFMFAITAVTTVHLYVTTVTMVEVKKRAE